MQKTQSKELYNTKLRIHPTEGREMEKIMMQRRLEGEKTHKKQLEKYKQLLDKTRI